VLRFRGDLPGSLWCDVLAVRTWGSGAANAGSPAIFRGVASDLPILEALVDGGGKIGKPDRAELLRISQERHLVDGVQCDLRVLDLSVEVGLTLLTALAIFLERRAVASHPRPI